jgi:competence protein ComEC
MSDSRPVLVLALAGLLVLAGCSGDVQQSPDVEPTQSTLATDASRSSGADSDSVNGTLEVHFINVGQSVSTLVISPEGETMLVDSGEFTDDGEYVLQYLRARDIDRIDHFVVSHNDADHIGGNAAVIEYFETEADGIGAVYDPGIAATTQTYAEYLDAVEQYEVPLYETRAGDRIQFAGVDVQVMGAPDPYIENRARNENSIVLKLTHGETSFLFTGDAEDDQEAQLVDTYGSQLRATVMKAGHHGSSSSTSGEILDAVQPKAVVISSAYDSRYGHPTEEMLGRLVERSIPAFWTATHGDIVLRSDGHRVTVATQRAAPTDPANLRAADAITPGTTGSVEARDTFGGEGTVGSGTSTQTQVVTDGGETETTPQLTLAAVNADAAGDDRENLNDEYVVFRNDGDGTLDLSGWTVSDEAGRTYTVPDGVTLAPGATITLHTGSGTETETDLYWGSGSPIWNNGGDTVTVTMPDGTEVLAEGYT